MMYLGRLGPMNITQERQEVPIVQDRYQAKQQIDQFITSSLKS